MVKNSLISQKIFNLTKLSDYFSKINWTKYESEVCSMVVVLYVCLLLLSFLFYIHDMWLHHPFLFKKILSTINDQKLVVVWCAAILFLAKIPPLSSWRKYQSSWIWLVLAAVNHFIIFCYSLTKITHLIDQTFILFPLSLPIRSNM